MDDMPYVDTDGKTYGYGEYFAPELSPFAYNETVAQEYFPLSKEGALAQGYSWRTPEKKDYVVEIQTKDLPLSISEVENNIIGKVIECEDKGSCAHQCTGAFKIIGSELQFYKKLDLPIPHKCPNCRHAERFAKHNPLQFWSRTCSCKGNNSTEHAHGVEPCTKEFETSYAPDRPEIIYCEKCYQSEVY